VSEVSQILQSLYASYQSEDYIKAELGIREALNKWPSNPEALQIGALTALAINQTVTAHQRIDRAMELTKMTAEMANIQGRVLCASGDWAAAEEAYNQAEKLDANFTRAKINRLNLFTLSEQPKGVLAELDSGHDFGEMGEVARSQAYTDLGRYDDALELLRELESETYADEILFQRIKCLAILGRLEEMLETFSALTITSNLYAKTIGVVVNSFEMRGYHERALTILDGMPKNLPPFARLQIVNLMRKLGRTDKANSDLQKLSNTFPDNVQVACAVALEERLAGKAEDSCKTYMRALTLKAADFSALLGYAEAAIVAGRLAEAQNLIQSALMQAPNNQFLLSLVATLRRQKGEKHGYLYDYKNFVRVYDLGPPEGYSDAKAFNSALKQTLHGLHVYKRAPLNQTLRLGSQTEIDLALVEDPVLQSFFKAIDAPIRDYMRNIGWDAVHPLRRRNRNDYRISGAWSVRLSENGHHVNHVHPMGWLSSVYYVDVPSSVNSDSQDGWIKFGEPPLDIGQGPEHLVQPKIGRLVLFPSYIWHGTIPFSGSATRLTLPFDVVSGSINL